MTAKKKVGGLATQKDLDRLDAMLEKAKNECGEEMAKRIVEWVANQYPNWIMDVLLADEHSRDIAIQKVEDFELKYYNNEIDWVDWELYMNCMLADLGWELCDGGDGSFEVWSEEAKECLFSVENECGWREKVEDFISDAWHENFAKKSKRQ